jgi:hypothetical protein
LEAIAPDALDIGDMFAQSAKSRSIFMRHFFVLMQTLSSAVPVLKIFAK